MIHPIDVTGIFKSQRKGEGAAEARRVIPDPDKGGERTAQEYPARIPDRVFSVARNHPDETYRKNGEAGVVAENGERQAERRPEKAVVPHGEQKSQNRRRRHAMAKIAIHEEGRSISEKDRDHEKGRRHFGEPLRFEAVGEERGDE